MCICDATTGEQLHILEGHENAVKSLDLSSDGNTLISASSDGSIRMWGVARGKDLQKWDAVGVSDFIVFSPTSGHFISCGWDGIALWDRATGRNIRRLEGGDNNVLAATFSPDGKVIGSGNSDGAIYLWDATTGKVLASLCAHEHRVESLAFSPNNMLVSASTDGTLCFWDVDRRQETHRVKVGIGRVLSVSCSRDGRSLVAGGEGGIRLWSTAEGQVCAEHGREQGCVFAVALSADWQTLITAGLDEVIHIWDCDTAIETRSLVGHVGRVNSAG